MLSRKTLGVAGVAILGSAALLATNTASAAINLDTGAGVKVAKETLLDSAVTMPSGTTTKYYDLVEGNAAAGAYDMQIKQGIAFGSGMLYLRIELMNMVFNSGTTAITATNSNTDSTTPAFVSGGTGGESNVVLSIAGDPDSTANDVLTIEVDSISVLPDAAGSVKATLHRDSLDAALGVNAIRTVMADDVVQVVDGLEEKVTSSGAMADVASGFSMFDDDGAIKTSAQIGYLRIKAMDNTMHRAGTAVRGPGSFLGAGDAITVTFKGDFSNHTFMVHPMMDCTGDALSGDDAPMLNKDKNELKVVLTNTAEGEGDGDTTDATADPQTKKVVMLALCMMVSEKNTMAIPNTDYMATVKYMKLANAMFPRAEQTLTIGSIGRTGTTVHIPFLTVNHRHHQRIVLMNRGTTDADYSLRFMMEEGRTATPGADASGMLPAGRVTVLSLRNDDVVTIEGGTRTSAELTVVADPKNIGVSTVIHSPDTGNTDTVVIQD